VIETRSLKPAEQAIGDFGASPTQTPLAGWGRLPIVAGVQVCSEDLERLTEGVPLTRGLGRAYGDAALPAAGDWRVAKSTLADRMLEFDPDSGLLRAEAGLSLDAIYRIFAPKGFFTPVTPGTRFVTLGGMVACDVHGKNHHRFGSIGSYVRFLRLRVAGGAIVDCTPTDHPDLFRATIGGMGLTGHILEVGLELHRIPSAWIVEESERIPDIDRFIDALKTAGRVWPMTAGWIDCLSRGRSLGRGVLYRGRWAERAEAPSTFPHMERPVEVPFMAPRFLLGRHTMRAMNAVNFWRHVPRVRGRVIHPRRFFYPLDALGSWNKLYGSPGFAQYQCVLPESAGHGAVRRFLELLTGRGGASFLCVIKDCGAEGVGVLSFPKPGISIALDIPMRSNTQSLVDALNEQVIAEGGRIYLAKDALTRREHFQAMEGRRIDEFLKIRRQWDPEGRIRSAQSVRLFGW
jgi:FAD/FMN-containing dehydrogenase